MKVHVVTERIYDGLVVFSSKKKADEYVSTKIEQALSSHKANLTTEGVVVMGEGLVQRVVDGSEVVLEYHVEKMEVL